MATLRFSIPPGGTVEDITVAAGAATVTNSIELTVDNATNLVIEGAGTRAIKKSEIVLALVNIIQAALKSTSFSED